VTTSRAVVLARCIHPARPALNLSARGMLPPSRRIQERAMTVQATRTDVVPTPRSATGEAAWVEPWLYSRSAHPRSEYWDVENARWTSRRAVPDPRSGS
jgi:hypothetical protein